MSPEGSPSKEGKPKQLVSPETAKLDLPTTPKSSHRAESFKRKLDAANIVVTMSLTFSLSCMPSRCSPVVCRLSVAHFGTMNLKQFHSFLSLLSSPRLLKLKQDSDGSTVWICPACGKVDDGTPMIGCDACDAWYHW